MSEKGDGVDLSALLKTLDAGKKSLTTARTLVAQIERLDRERAANHAKLKQHATRLRNVASESTSQSVLVEVADWASEYLEQLQAVENRRAATFGAELEHELSRHGIHLTGQSPELRALVFTIEIDLAHDRARLWYGPKQERLEDVGLAPAQVAERLQRLERKLGCGLAPPDFADRLDEAYRRAMSSEDPQGVPIGRALSELAFLMQNKRFHEDPRSENYRSYSRADFAEDLFHARDLGRFQLMTAVRALTRRRSDFLWVPSDRAGNGTTISHIRISEERT